MSPDLSEALDDDELDLLHETLMERAEGDSLLLDGVHGLITAVAIGPEAVPPSEWMPLVLEPGKPFQSTEEAEHMVTLLLRLSNMAVRDLERLAYEPILSQVETEAGEAAYSAHGWCEGFAMGIDVRADRWERALQDDPSFLAIMRPIIALAADEGVFANDDDEDPTPLSEAEYEAALNDLPAAVLNIQQYWRDHQPDPLAEPGPAPEPEPEAKSEPGTTVPRHRAGRSVH
jgi:uncharacterized protein